MTTSVFGASDRPARSSPRVPALLLMMLALALALAACGTPAQVSDPSAAAAPVPRIDYQPALTDYQPFEEPSPLSWRDANDRAGPKSAGVPHDQKH